MAAELKEVRIRVTLETFVALSAQARAFDQDLSEVARELLDAWAVKKAHEHTVYERLLKAEGLSAAPERRSREAAGVVAKAAGG